MQKSVIWMLVLLFLITNVYALDCQYKVNETYQEFGTWLFDSRGNYYGEPLILKDFNSAYCGFDCNGKPSFVIENQYSQEMQLNLSALLLKPATQGNAYPEAKQIITQEIILPAYGEYKFEGNPIGIGSNYFSNDSITYEVYSPEELTLKKGYRDLQREICKNCTNGKQCLDNGASCNSNDECGSNICNLAKVCGSIGSLSVVPCPAGLLNCNNQSCLAPSTKNVGEAYKCEFECISQRGENGTCLKSLEEIKADNVKSAKKLVYWFIGIILVVSFISLAYWKFLYKRWIKGLGARLNELERVSKLKEKEINQLESHGADLSIKIKKYEELIENKNKEANSIGELIKLKESELKEASIKSKSIVEEAIRNLISKSRKIKSETLALEIETEKFKEARMKRNTEIEEGKKLRENEIKERKDKALYETAKLLRVPKEKLEIDNGRIRYSKSLINPEQKGAWAHIELYKRYIRKPTSNEEVHHIDGDELNNNLWNLIAIDIKKHFGIHGTIKTMDWADALNYLIAKKIVGEMDLHKFIKQHRKEIEEQQKLKR